MFDHFEVYRAQLAQYAHFGHALWRPDSTETNGRIEIGDIGYLEEGTFKRCFNVIEDDSAKHGVKPMEDYAENKTDKAVNFVQRGLHASNSIHRQNIGGGGGAYVSLHLSFNSYRY